MKETDPSLVQKSVNTIRTLSIDAIQKANSGHPGLPLGAAPMAYALWARHLKHHPRNPDWPDRDRFVLSAGHGSMLLYSLLHLTGYDLSMDDIRSFRQWGSRTPGHPEAHMTPGVECTTGPLGQGIANGVGMAITERHLAYRFNRKEFDLVNHYTYVLVGDGDLMEGISSEAVSYAGHLGLGKLILLYDSNDITLDGPTSLSFSGEDVKARFDAYGWQTLEVKDGDHDVDGVDRAIREAKEDPSRPSILLIKTTIGFGSPNRGGKSSAHGSPLGDEEIALTKEALGWESGDPFHVPDDVRDHMGEAVTRGAAAEKIWNGLFERYEKAHPDLALQWKEALAGNLPDGWDDDLPSWEPGEKVATRSAAGAALHAIAARVPWLIGGDADLSSSTKTRLPNEKSFDAQTGEGRNLHFGVREHAMGGIANGMAYHGGAQPFVATFLCFSDYMRGSVRLAAMNKLPVRYVWTHDSIEVGEDGPTHQPVEHVMSLRTIPGLVVFRPADGGESVEAWRWAVQNRDRPVALILSRQGLPVIDRKRHPRARNLARGGYVLAEASGKAPQAIIIATGSEVAPALEAREELENEGFGVRVVSLPSWELFADQDQAYRDAVMPPEIDARVSVEAGVTLGWERWIGLTGIAIGVDRFGASAPGPLVREKYGLVAKPIVDAVRKLAGRGE